MKIFLLLLLFSLPNLMLSQDFTQKQLESMEDEELLSLFMKVEHDSIRAETVARTYLNRARMQNDTIKMARGYDRLARIFHPKKNLQFADSIIDLTKNIENITYPAQGYILKSYAYHLQNDLINETENGLKAYDLAIRNENISQVIYISDFIIYNKSRWGNEREALRLQKKRHAIMFKKNYFKSLEKSSRTEARGDLDLWHLENELSSIQNFVFCYLNLKELDSARQFIDKGFKKTSSYGDYNNYKEDYRKWFEEALAEVEFYDKNYESCIELSNTVLSEINLVKKSNTNLNLNFLLGLSYIELNEQEKGIKHLKISDSIFNATNQTLMPYQRKLFEALHDYYLKKNEKEKQIEYLNKLLNVDSIFKLNYQYFEPDVIKNFETPLLLTEKESVIKSLESKNKQSNIIKWMALSSLGLSLLLLFYYIKKQKKYRLRFKGLLATQIIVDNGIDKARRNELSSTLINDILNGLDNFEDKLLFLKQDITLRKLSKSIGTNERYLSKVINLEKDKNFSNYINDLRIDYSVRQLIENSKFRRYTIKAIANEFGFRTSESFSKAFYKRCGIYPSYFLKNIEKSPDKGVKKLISTILQKTLPAE